MANPNDRAVEAQIAAELWRWQFAKSDARDSILCNSEFLLMFEFWFPFSEIEFTLKRKIWCDGVLHLEVQELNPVSFLIAGIGCFPRSISPFEIEFHFTRIRDETPAFTVLRFGQLDEKGGLRTFGHHTNYLSVMDLRPKTNLEWAVAVELTASNTNDSE